MEMHQVRYFLAVARMLNFTRGADECNVTQPSLTRAIKQLDAELDVPWDRLDTWPLFTEHFQLVVSKQHRLAGRDKVELEDLRSEQWLSRTFCEHADRLSAVLREHGIDINHGHEIASEHDLVE